MCQEERSQVLEPPKFWVKPADPQHPGPPRTHCVDPRELLGQLQDDGDEDGLAIHGGTEELHYGDLLLPHHLPALLLHLLEVAADVRRAPQLLEDYREEREVGSGAAEDPPAWRDELGDSGHSPLLALFSSLRLMRRKRGLSGAKGRMTHCSRAGMKMNPRSSGQSESFPMIKSKPNT